jgi:hypothetical protein
MKQFFKLFSFITYEYRNCFHRITVINSSSTCSRTHQRILLSNFRYSCQLICILSNRKTILTRKSTMSSKASSAMFLLLFIITLALPQPIDGGPALAIACIATCNAGAVACYSAAGFTFGAVTAGLSTPFVIIGCNMAQGACMAACATSVVAPTP